MAGVFCGEGLVEMLNYGSALKANARALRRNMTDAEQTLWARLRRKQVCGVQFYRQKPIGACIVDFYAPSAGLVVEVDGSQHMEIGHVTRDAARDAYLAGVGLHVLRFDNLQVLQELEVVLSVIETTVRQRLNPPQPPFVKGGSESGSEDVPPFEKGGLGGISEGEIPK